MTYMSVCIIIDLIVAIIVSIIAFIVCLIKDLDADKVIEFLGLSICFVGIMVLIVLCVLFVPDIVRAMKI